MGSQREVRIIGGRWRGRKLAFTAAEGLRPTGDRIRETLFNWLAPCIAGARCVDLFAGSGALGFEALSRGASHCDFVDSSTAVIQQLNQQLQKLDALRSGACHRSSAQQFLQAATQAYDIVFIDPPFKLQLASLICSTLTQRQLLNEGAMVYVETEASDPSPMVPDSWLPHRSKVSGAVAYRLFHVTQVKSLP